MYLYFEGMNTVLKFIKLIIYYTAIYESKSSKLEQ